MNSIVEGVGGGVIENLGPWVELLLVLSIIGSCSYHKKKLEMIKKAMKMGAKCKMPPNLTCVTIVVVVPD